MTRLYFDTETTGTIPRDRSLENRPHIVQLAAVLIDDENGEEASLNLIVNPNVKIPDEAAAIHGITTAKAQLLGVPKRVALALFSHLCRLADETVAHNHDFDSAVILAETERLENKMESFIHLPRFCTMKAATSICEIPGRYGSFKWPKLQEVYVHFFGEEFDGAHDALADVRACARVHAEILRRESETV